VYSSTPTTIELPLPQHDSSTSPLPSPSSKRSLLGHLKRIPRPPRPRVPFRGNAQQRRAALFKPLSNGDSPLGTLVIQVQAARNLVAKVSFAIKVKVKIEREIADLRNLIPGSKWSL
jgi:hypothetical protein